MTRNTLEVLVESLIAGEIESRFNLPLARAPEDGRAEEPRHGLCIRGAALLGGLPIDEAMIFVLTNWAQSLDREGPVIDPDKAKSDPDFWQRYDRAQDQFMSLYLNPVLPFEPLMALRAPDRTVEQVYEQIVREAEFADRRVEEPTEVAAARKLLFAPGEEGHQQPTPGYRRFLELETELLEARLELDELPADASGARRDLLESRVSRAETAWNVEGERARYEEARQRVNAHARRVNTENDRTRLLEALESAMIDSIAEPGRTYPATTLSPLDSLVAEPGHGLWQSFDLENLDRDRGMDQDIVRRLGGTPAEVQEEAGELHAVRFTVGLFDIHRTWLNWKFLRESFWSLRNGMVSDGRGGGMLPAVADGIVLLRDLEVSVLRCTVTDRTSGETARSRQSRAQELAISGEEAALQAIEQQQAALKTTEVEKDDFTRKAAAKGINPPEHLLRPRRPPSNPKQKAMSRMEAEKASHAVSPAVVTGEGAERMRDTLRERTVVKARRGKAARDRRAPGTVTASIALDVPPDMPDDALKIHIVRIVRGEDRAEGKSTPVEPAGGAWSDDFDFETTLGGGSYRLSVDFRGEEVFSKAFRIGKRSEPPEFDLRIAVDEDLMVESRGGLNLFGYRARRVPRRPDPEPADQR